MLSVLFLSTFLSTGVLLQVTVLLKKGIGHIPVALASREQAASGVVALSSAGMLAVKVFVVLSMVVYAESAPMYNQTFSPWTVMGPVRHKFAQA